MPQVYEKDIRDIKGSFKLEVVLEPMMVIAIAVHPIPGNNHKVKIPCVNCLPLTGYKYSNINDTYAVSCIDHLDLGMIRVSYKAKMRGTAGWEIKVPMPVSVIRRYLELEQRRNLREFQDKFKGQDVGFEFIQMISAY